MKHQSKRFDGRISDLSCSWFTALYGDDWEIWRAYADEWLHQLNIGLDPRRKAVNWFLESYLVEQGLPSDPELLFRPNENLPDLLVVIEI